MTPAVKEAAQSASTQEGFKIMSLVRLEFLTDDNYLAQLCTLYWQVDQEGHFAYKVADLARNSGLSTNELSKKVKNSCRALSTANFCYKCEFA